MNSLIEDALQLALIVHKGQIDNVGEPYIFHVLRVAGKAQNPVEYITGLLHDVIEDGYGWPSIELLLGMGFPREICSAVEALSRCKGEKYFDYIERLSRNPLAVIVKLYDLTDNLAPKRSRGLKIQSLRERYEKATAILINKIEKHSDKYDLDNVQKIVDSIQSNYKKVG